METEASDASATTDEAYRAWKAILQVQAFMVAELERRTEEAGVLPPTWLDLLLKVSQAPEKRERMSVLAGKAFLTRGGVTRLVTRIEAQGLLRREPCEDDGRGAYAVLTPAGADALKRAGPVYRNVLIQRITGHLSSRQAIQVAETLETLLAGNAWSEPSPTTAWHADG